MKRTLYLMRHGQTAFNAQNLSQGWSDSPLTDEGIKQAHSAASKIKELCLNFDYFCCSTQERASDTLELIMQDLYGKLVPYDRYKGLKECNWGSYEGVSLNLLLAFSTDEDAIANFGGETSDEIVERVSATLTQIMQSPDHTSVLAISHMRSAMLFLEHVDSSCTNEEYSAIFNNCAMLVFEFDDETFQFSFKELIRTNETDALAPAQSL